MKLVFGFVAECIRRSEDPSRAASDRQFYVDSAIGLLNHLTKKLTPDNDDIWERAYDPFETLAVLVVAALKARISGYGGDLFQAMREDAEIEEGVSIAMDAVRERFPFWIFCYVSANTAINEKMEDEKLIHIIDFKIEQGEQWVQFLRNISVDLKQRVRISAVDDSESVRARGGGLSIVGEKLSGVASSLGIAFEFCDTGLMGAIGAKLESFNIQQGEAVAVNLPYVMKLLPDRVDRERLLLLVKNMSPKVLTLVEQECGANDANYFARFLETVEYYTFLMDCIHEATQEHDRDFNSRIHHVKVHWLGKEMTNILSCHGAHRVLRPELFKEWSQMLKEAGFSPMAPAAGNNVRKMIAEYGQGYMVVEGAHALFLRWKSRALIASSAWD